MESASTPEQYLYSFKENVDYVVPAGIYGPHPHGEAGVGDLPNSSPANVRYLRERRRPDTHVSDIVDANILALNSPSGAIYNLGRGIETTDLEMFQTVQETVGSNVEPLFAEMRPGEVQHIALDASKAEGELGWKWKVDLIEGISRAVEFYRTVSGE